ncbi:MAG: CBS domain-containing protein [Devosiaceae bacterium]|nr:CBS domain-containing protein [Devosiaceae bacterium MH13]
MQVSAILAEKGHEVATASPETLMIEVMETLAERNIGAIVVTDAGRRVAGIISERDIVRSLARNGASALDQPVSSFMTKTVVSCSASESTHDLMAKMTEGRFRHLPVVADGKLDGIISIGDVVAARISEVQREADALRDYIASN